MLSDSGWYHSTSVSEATFPDGTGGAVLTLLKGGWAAPHELSKSTGSMGVKHIPDQFHFLFQFT